MKRNGTKFVSVGAALSALTLPAAHAQAISSATENVEPGTEAVQPASGQANRHVNVSGELMSFLVTTGSSGTVIAQHVSHASHESHASHASSVTP